MLKINQLLFILGVILCIISIFLPIVNTGDTFIYNAEPFSILVYAGIILALSSLIIKKHSAKIKIIANVFLSTFLITLLYFYYIWMNMPTLELHKSPIILLHGFYIYAVGVILIWISITFSRKKQKFL
jgi:hypothetical protein